MHEILLTKKADKDLSKLPKSDQSRVIKKIERLSPPFPKNYDIKLLTGTSGFYRLRVGRLRIVIEIDDKKKEIWVRRIGYRGSIYGLL